MKKQDVVILVSKGVTHATNHTLPVEHAYKVVKFKRELSLKLDAICEEEDAIRRDVGIKDPKEFDERLGELRKKSSLTEAEAAELKDMEEKLARFKELRKVMLQGDVTLDVKKMPYDAWHALQCENANCEIDGEKVDLFSGYAEDVLEGVLWEAPKEED